MFVIFLRFAENRHLAGRVVVAEVIEIEPGAVDHRLAFVKP